jgi:DNA-binding LacI/PurR family transcriptional regulator
MPRSKPTLDDVGAMAGVSRSTVSRVVNNNPSVAAEVRARVARAVELLGYRPDPAARALVSGRSDVIDLVVVDDESTELGINPYYSRVVAGMLDALRDTEVRMRAHLVDLRRAPARLDEIAGDAGLGAVLVNVPAALAAAHHRRSSHVVSLGRMTNGVACVDSENAAGATAAVNHLYEQGRRRIAAINGPQWSPCAVGRRAGYLDAMRDAALPAVAVTGEFRREAGAEGTRRLLAGYPDLDAIFVSCDLAATGALQVLAGSGRRVPDDVAVVGFDGSVLSMCTTPPLTSVYQPVERAAAAATRMLLDRQADGGAAEVVPTWLIVRQSSVVSA